MRLPHFLHDLPDLQDRRVDDEEAFDDEHDQDQSEQDILERLELPDANGGLVRGGQRGRAMRPADRMIVVERCFAQAAQGSADL